MANMAENSCCPAADGTPLLAEIDVPEQVSFVVSQRSVCTESVADQGPVPRKFTLDPVAIVIGPASPFAVRLIAGGVTWTITQLDG